ncbi:unnamed protein product [Bemisia tabaci]|uniref:28S ribosomal protein S24, mitochondrial n=1 Tax=Bemisia tabaci TaxID=7038 RepID=A0A9P0A2Y2_BEMTA|nr:unnamed protein product [Bemisia tabaci]
MMSTSQVLKATRLLRWSDAGIRSVQTSCVDYRKQAGRHFPTRYRTKPLTYEMAHKPHQIAHHKGWNSWNTTNLGGDRDQFWSGETAAEDQFIRQFITGTWHNMFASEVIIKRQHNIIRIAGIISRMINPTKMYFLIGYSEEILSYWLQCPVKLELQTINDKSEVIYKYI